MMSFCYYCYYLLFFVFLLLISYSYCSCVYFFIHTMQVIRHELDYGCWFVNDEVCSSQFLSMITPCDPVFLALPYLLKQHTVNVCIPTRA